MAAPQYPFRRYERKPFDAERCTRCGRCLSECPVLRLPDEQAREEIVRLMECLVTGRASGESTARVLERCTSCMACNLICPEDCRPANLILEIWHRQYRQEGLPVRARYFLPHSVPNFRTYVIDRLPRVEKAVVESWKSMEPVDEILYPGCNLITAPYLTFSRLFEDIPIRGALEYCCGEMYFRMGLYDQLEQVARKMTGYFRTLRVKRVHLLCTAGLNLFTNILPQFGADFSGIEFQPYLKRLHEALVSGELPIEKRFDGKTVAVQDSCHGKMYEDRFYLWPRKILEILGFRIVEASQHGTGSLCCGIGSGFSHDAAFAKGALIGGQRRCFKNVAAARADYVAAYCTGCLEMLSVAKFMFRPQRPVYHVVELIQFAIGETPKLSHRKTAFDFLRGVLRHQESGTARFFIEPIT